jgi:hypothetical protein
VATEGPAVTPVEQPAAARTEKQEAASPDTASTVAEGSRTSAAVEEPVAAAPETTSAEEAAARAATVPVEVDTATRRSAQTRQPHSLRYGSKTAFLILFFNGICVNVTMKIVTLQCFQPWKQYSTVSFAV